MSLYPSLEDMKVDKILQQDQHHQQQQNRSTAAPTAPLYYPLAYPGTNPSQQHYDQQRNARPLPTPPQSASIYPTMNAYMDLDLTSVELQIIQNQEEQFKRLQLAQQSKNQVAVYSNNKEMIAPLSGNSIGLKRSQITHGVREVILCKGQDGKLGMRCKSISNGIFVVLVTKGSPAALAGLRFGDQILQCNDEYVAGMSHEKLHAKIKKLPGEKIILAVRDRPMERTITLHKDNGGEAGFIFSNGKITSIVKDSSAARNGLLTDHQILEVNGQNVVGCDDKKIREFIKNSENTLTLTIIPTIIYDKMMQNMANSLIKKLMDHSIFDY